MEAGLPDAAGKLVARGRRGAGLGVLLAALLLMLGVVAACSDSPRAEPTRSQFAGIVGDPGWRLTLQIYNMTGRSVRVTVSQLLVKPYVESPREWVSTDLALSPGEMREARLAQGVVPQDPTVRAYADGRLISCRRYDFSRVQVTLGPAPAYSVEIVAGQIAPGCKDLRVSP